MVLIIPSSDLKIAVNPIKQVDRRSDRRWSKREEKVGREIKGKTKKTITLICRQ